MLTKNLTAGAIDLIQKSIRAHEGVPTKVIAAFMASHAVCFDPSFETYLAAYNAVDALGDFPDPKMAAEVALNAAMVQLKLEMRTTRGEES